MRLLTVALMVPLAALGGCAATVGDRIDSAPRSSVQPAAPTADPAADHPVLGPAPADIRAVNWAATPLPGEFCDVPEVLPFTGETVTSPTNGDVVLHVDPSRVSYGDLDRDGHDEAAVPVYCGNGGGMASGQIAFGYVVAQVAGGSLRAVGTVTAQQQLADASHVTLLDGLRFKEPGLVVEETFYRASDATCCPSGTALTAWTYRDGRLTPGAPAITTAAETEADARQVLTDFLAAWRRGDDSEMSRLADADGLSRFTEDPASWTSADLNWTPECEPGTSGSGSCAFVLISPQGGGVTYVAHYYRVDRSYKINSFESLGGGA
jgi:hypothetical protein